MKLPERFEVAITLPNGDKFSEFCDQEWELYHYKYYEQYHGWKIEIFEDMRYKAKKRLYRIWLFKHNHELWDRLYSGKSVFHGTEIGKTIPILQR